MFAEIAEYIGTQKSRILFRPYSHEDFTYFDRGQQHDLRFGLDDVKLYTQKYFIGDTRLVSVIEEMRTKAEFADKLVIPEPGDYHNDPELIAAECKRGGFDPSHSLFLVMDHSLDDEGTHRGDLHFIICYDQKLVNENPFHLFDENKPAWADHTTLPHTLAGAMINITRPYWPKDGKVSVCDCFVGSGTTLLEASKFDDTECAGVDLEPIGPQLVHDNIEFFSASAAEVRETFDSLSLVLKELTQPDQSLAARKTWKNSDEGVAYEEAQGLHEQWERWNAENMRVTASSAEIVASLASKRILVKLLFYTKLKAVRRFEAAISSGSISREFALRHEITDLLAQIYQLISLRERTSAAKLREGHRLKYEGRYSDALSINDSYLSTLKIGLPARILVQDIKDWSPNAVYDVIITDPPYGFNTNQDRRLLADVYACALRKAIGCLRNGGQLVIALPDWSHTGRQIPAFALKDFVAHQVLTIAEELKREVIHSAIQVPHSIGGPPYYWESEKALRRAILHFRFRHHTGYRRHAPRSLDEKRTWSKL
jgi:tRNA G10  N-methylase Trm11